MAIKKAGLVLAARSPEAFATFPPIQRVTESAANALCAEIIGIPTDYFFGPFLFVRELARHVARAPSAIGWGWRPMFFATAHRAGYRIAAAPCPAARRERARTRGGRADR
jgi:hypothetical protein